MMTPIPTIRFQLGNGPAQVRVNGGRLPRQAVVCAGDPIAADLGDPVAALRWDREWGMVSDRGRSPQGASASPLLANVYLHYVFDLWAVWWRRRHAHGDVIIVRWADDFIVGFEHEQDARRFLDELRERFARFGLELHPDKTRLIEFGRHAARRRRQRIGSHADIMYRNFRGFLAARIWTIAGTLSAPVGRRVSVCCLC